MAQATGKPIARLGGGRLFEISQVVDIERKLGLLRKILGKSLTSVRPEYGAYMSYSIWLELPAKKMPPHVRPHIRPSLSDNATHIAREFINRITPIAKAVYNGDGELKTRREVGKIWKSILMGKPREDAVKNAPIEFGFHRRSISAFVNARTRTRVEALNRRALRERAEAAKSARRKR